jgi:hypothetical protein
MCRSIEKLRGILQQDKRQSLQNHFIKYNKKSRHSPPAEGLDNKIEQKISVAFDLAGSPLRFLQHASEPEKIDSKHLEREVSRADIILQINEAAGTKALLSIGFNV